MLETRRRAPARPVAPPRPEDACRVPSADGASPKKADSSTPQPGTSTGFRSSSIPRMERPGSRGSLRGAVARDAVVVDLRGPCRIQAGPGPSGAVVGVDRPHIASVELERRPRDLAALNEDLERREEDPGSDAAPQAGILGALDRLQAQARGVVRPAGAPGPRTGPSRPHLRGLQPLGFTASACLGLRAEGWFLPAAAMPGPAPATGALGAA